MPLYIYTNQLKAKSSFKLKKTMACMGLLRLASFPWHIPINKLKFMY